MGEPRYRFDVGPKDVLERALREASTSIRPIARQMLQRAHDAAVALSEISDPAPAYEVAYPRNGRFPLGAYASRPLSPWARRWQAAWLRRLDMLPLRGVPGAMQAARRDYARSRMVIAMLKDDLAPWLESAREERARIQAARHAPARSVRRA